MFCSKLACWVRGGGGDIHHHSSYFILTDSIKPKRNCSLIQKYIQNPKYMNIYKYFATVPLTNYTQR